MSGSSLDGLDICYTHLEETRGVWTFDIREATCIPYDASWTEQLRRAPQLDAAAFLRLHTAYGRYIGEKVNSFIEEHNLEHQVHFVATHGHTVFHEPASFTSFQLGDGAAIAAAIGFPVISDLRSVDVALGGQGAPIVSIGDKLLFGEFDYCLNIGGIVNLTVSQGEQLLAFDVCTGNQALNKLAETLGQDFDQGGELARQGKLLPSVLSALNNQEYFKKSPPKSLSNDAAIGLIFPVLMESEHLPEDRLRTVTQHIAEQVANAVKLFPNQKEAAKMLVTGGGAFNSYLVSLLQDMLEPMQVSVVVPNEQVVMYKEALVMALIGTLRWREETNVLSSVTGATRDSISGALWMGDSYS